jgi:RHS repeat-associated protein
VVEGERADGAAILVDSIDGPVAPADARRGFDKSERLLKLRLRPLVNVTNFILDAVGNLLSVTDPLRQVTQYAYDNLYRRTSTTDALNGVTSFTYDAVGNMLSLTDPVNNTTSWVYDALNRVVAETNQLSFTRYFVYDAVGNLTRRTDRNGRAIEYTYDNLYRRTQENWLDEYGSPVRTIDWAYNAAGQLTAASDLAGSFQYQYDALGRQTQETHEIAGLSSQVIMSSTYDSTGNRLQLAATIGGTADFVTEYTYDALRRMTRIQQHDVGYASSVPVAEKRIDLAYDAASQWQTITRYADLSATKLVATSSYTYDAAGRLTSLDHSQGSTSLAGYSWQYDAGNRVTQLVSLLDGTVDYNYDDTNQLTGADYAYQGDETYAYDANGNRTISGYVTGPNNQLLSDGTYDYDYDNEGNRILRTNIVTGETTEYEWDHRNRLIKITDKDDIGEITQVAEYTYDFQNRRIAKSLSTLNSPLSTTFYLYDGNRWERGNAGDHIALQFDGDGTLTNRYLYGPAVDQILADEQIDEVLGLTTPGEVLWPLTDNHGTVRDVAQFDDVTGATSIANHIAYNAFGQINSETSQAVDYLFAFTGRERDEESGMNYHRARYYDSLIGRWISEDPLQFAAGDSQLSRYARNNTTNSIDPSGLVDPDWDSREVREMLVREGYSGMNHRQVLEEWRRRKQLRGPSIESIVACYDGNDAMGEDLKEAANDFKFNYPVGSWEELISQLKRHTSRYGRIAQLWIFDHGYFEAQQQQVGDQGVPAERFRELELLLDTDATIYLIGCRLGQHTLYCQDVANSANRDVVVGTSRWVMPRPGLEAPNAPDFGHHYHDYVQNPNYVPGSRDPQLSKWIEGTTRSRLLRFRPNCPPIPTTLPNPWPHTANDHNAP